ncbi:uncharacterized protein EI90DRAFT_2264188 [Cantharellus anzutake]|uniref:uncharacterized protein n=1 Tax=Cantharellus anzutake TaxID=1750568 RepID=UPI00190378B5|nr:uncharacterized protein EI90DRAFT_2264188 [Cantharellus anzutake]KAF8339647.1 hypothetical protein EI90DRAFT_2264188 [Cantharellus anzutake]
MSSDTFDLILERDLTSVRNAETRSQEDVPPHSAGVPTKSSSKRKPCDQCVQNRTKCDTSIPCGKCVYHNLACSRVPDSLGRANGSVGGPSYVPSSIPSSPYYNHRGATTSAASLPDLSSEGHYHHYRSRRLSDAGSASSRASYSTSGSVGNLGFDSGLQLNPATTNVSHQSGYNVTDATPLASHQSRNPLETYAAVAAATAASAPSNHPYANLLNQPGGVVSPANSGGVMDISSSNLLPSLILLYRVSLR